MKMMKNTILACGLATMLAMPAFAADRVVMKDGREFVGTITQETEYVVRIDVTYGEYTKEMILFAGDIAKIEKDVTVDVDTPTRDSSSAGADTATATAIAENQPGVLVLPMTGGVGQTFRHHEIEMVAEEARRIKKETGEAPIIVLEIESGGGAMSEMYAIHDTLIEVKKDFRVVAWIKEAISAAAATAFHCDEIYFRTDGNLGAMTGYNSGSGQSLQGEMLEMWLRDAAAWAEAGGRFGQIAKSMIRNEFELSYDVDPETGEITWHDDLSGEFILSTGERNLTLTSSTAVHCGFADGIADNEAELAELLDLPRWNEVSSYGRQVHADWNETFERAQEEIPLIYQRLRIAQESAAADTVEKIGRTISLLEKLINWWDRAPYICENIVPIPPRDQLERQIRELRKQLADLRAAERRARQNRRGRGG